jgi:adenylate cyclase
MSFAIWLRRFRLATGLVLMAFVAGHLVNIALGLVSLETVDAATTYLMLPWQSRIGEALLIVSTLVHTIAGLQAILVRRSLAMSVTDIVQIVLALLVPPLLLAHIVVTRLTVAYIDGFYASYGLVLAVLWQIAPLYGLQQLLVVLIVWTHGAIGIYSRLVLWPIWRWLGGIVLAILFAVPVLALLGFVAAGKTVLQRLATDVTFQQSVHADLAKIAAVQPQLDAIANVFLIGYGVLAAGVAAILVLRAMQRRRQAVMVTYDGGHVARARPWLTLLEISQLNAIPHAHVCSGRGRCGTCRVEVEEGAARLSAMEILERRTLEKIHAGANVRLACQAHLASGEVRITRLVPAFADASAVREPEEWGLASATPESETVS